MCVQPGTLTKCAPATDLFANFSTLPLPFSSAITAAKLPPFPPTLREPTLELASSHLVCSVVLTGVLALQAGRWWAEQADVDEDDGPDGEDGGMRGERDNDEAAPETEKPAEEPQGDLRKREKAAAA